MRNTSVVSIVTLLAHLLLPLASPFSLSRFTAATSAAQSASSRQPYTNIRAAAGVVVENDQHTVSSSSAASTSRLLRFLANLNPVGVKTNNRWKGGEHNATIPTRLLFRYASPLLDIAAERQLQESDSFVMPEQRSMSRTVPRLESIYQKCRSKARKKIEKQRQEGNKNVEASESLILLKSLLIHQRRVLLVTGCLRLLNTSIQAFPALLVARLLRLIESGDKNPTSKALWAAVSLVSVLSVKMITENQYFHNVVQCATQTRGSLAGMIFDKSMRLPSGSEGTSVSFTDQNKKTSLGAGGVLNLMQSDASTIESAALQFHTTWDGPLQIAMYTSLLFRYLGPSVLWGILVLVMVIPLNSITLRILNRMRRFENEAKDSRTKRTTEAISNMKLLKLQAWEKNFAADIRTHRKEELRRHVSRGVIRALNQAISNAVPALVLVVTLTAYSKTGRPILASNVFTAISLFNQLRLPLFFLPMLIDSFANGQNALKRVSTYLSSEEITPYTTTLPPNENGGGGGITMTNGNFLWPSSKTSSSKSSKTADTSDAAEETNEAPESSTVPALCSVNLNVNAGEVVAVVGNTGAGKSALVKGLLGELSPVPRALVDQAPIIGDDINGGSRTNGSPVTTSNVLDKPSVTTYGNVAYCAQEAWLPKGTLRDAIVFGREYDEARYKTAIHDAGLDDDIVEDGLDDAVSSKSAANRGVLSHDTDVGEGGSSLSGGQRARVALARALYGGDDTKVFLFDDPLAALDASVGATVFERISERTRASNAATVLVTNDPNLPRRCDRVVLMGKSGSASSCSTIIDVGTYDELIARGHNLRSFSEEDETEIEGDVEAEDGPDDRKLSQTISVESVHKVTTEASMNGVHDDHHLAAHGASNSTTATQHTGPDGVNSVKDSSHLASEKVVPAAPDHSPHSVPIQPSASVSTNDGVGTGQGLQPPPPSSASTAATTTTTTTSTSSSDSVSSLSSNSDSITPKSRQKLVSADDKMATGAVPFSTYVAYFKSVRKPILIAAMLLSYMTANGAQFFQQYMVAKWTEIGTGDAMATALGLKYLQSLVYAAGVVSVFLWLRSFLTMRVGVKASAFWHNRMLNSVFSAPMSFFDATPSGQLLSRFGKEIETVDSALPDGIGSVLFCFLQIFMSAGALAGIITPVMMLPLLVVGFMYARTMGRFRPAARDLKRGESKTRSPIYTHFGEALRGTDTIRSIPNARMFWSKAHRDLTDKNLSVFASVKALDRWLSIRLETLGNGVVFAAAVVSVYLTRAGKLQAGSAGWGLTQALAITGLLTWAVRCLTDLETYMMSVVRIQELTNVEEEGTKKQGEKQSQQEDLLQSEQGILMPKEKGKPGEALMALYQAKASSSANVTMAPLSDAALVATGWPWKGDIAFENVSMRYNKVSPLVLKRVSIGVPRGSTLGVVGRTGSGKSSLLLTLFRLVEIEDGGSITIDGVDIRSVSLQTLRQSLSIIPQDPVLFAGTLMYNLDATGKASRIDAWAALEAASPELAQQFKDTGTGLDTHISEGGKNLSSGQRQLICLARALLRKSKILVMDEATSSVDSKTDAQVQETIRREFVEKGVTVMTVAHRLETVLGYDKIAVLGGGELAEYGSPSELLKNPNGELRRLVDADNANKRKGAAASARMTGTDVGETAAVIASTTATVAS